MYHVSTDTAMYKIEVTVALGLIRDQPGGVDPTYLVANQWAKQGFKWGPTWGPTIIFGIG